MAIADIPNRESTQKVLLISYVFPPFFSVGGSIRVVKFVKYFPSLGWEPVVLTIDDTREYEGQRKVGSETLLSEIHESVKIYRTGAGEPSLELLEKGRQARRHSKLAAAVVNFLKAVRQFINRYLLLPDRTIVWLPFAVKLGRQIVQEDSIDVIFVTCPPYSSSLIGVALKWICGKPLAVDFRDDWIDTPGHRLKPWLVQWIERQLEKLVVKSAYRVILVTEESKKAFRDRYPSEPAGKFAFIPNGCDLEDFAFVRRSGKPKSSMRFTVLHAGLLSEAEGWTRNPKAVFDALARIRKSHPDVAANLVLEFTGYLPRRYWDIVRGMNISGMVRQLGDLPHRACIRAMADANLLLAINYDDWSTIIPAKLYEYWAVGGPPVLLLSCAGAADSFVRKYELGFVARPYDTEAIEHTLLLAYRQWEGGSLPQISLSGIDEFDRRRLAERLAQSLSLVERPVSTLLTQS